MLICQSSNMLIKVRAISFFPYKWLNLHYLKVSIYTAMWGKADGGCVRCAVSRCWDLCFCSLLGVLFLQDSCWWSSWIQLPFMAPPGTQSKPKWTTLQNCSCAQGTFSTKSLNLHLIVFKSSLTMMELQELACIGGLALCYLCIIETWGKKNLTVA